MPPANLRVPLCDGLMSVSGRAALSLAVPACFACGWRRSRCHWRCCCCCICFLAINVACSRRTHRHQRLQFLCLLLSLSLCLSFSLFSVGLSVCPLCALYLSAALFFAHWYWCAASVAVAVVVEECLGGNVNVLPGPALLSRSLSLSLYLSGHSVHFLQGAVAVAIQNSLSLLPPSLAPTGAPCKRVGFSCPLFPHDSSLGSGAPEVMSSARCAVMKKNPKTTCGCFSTFARSFTSKFIFSFPFLYLISFLYRIRFCIVEFSLLIG